MEMIFYDYEPSDIPTATVYLFQNYISKFGPLLSFFKESNGFNVIDLSSAYRITQEAGP